MFTRESRPLVHLLVLASLSVALMVLDKTTQLLDQARSALSIPLSSVQYLARLPVEMGVDLVQSIKSHNALLRENETLLTDQLLLKTRLQRLQAVESENRQLRALLHASVRLQGRVLVAQLLPVDTDPFMRRPLLDRGRLEGLFLGQPVLDASGVMGQVIRVNPTTSQILLINDPHSGIPVEVVRSGVRAIAVGDAWTGKLRLANVPQTADVKPNDLLVTSGIGKNYPQGYPVGKVESVVRDPGQQFATIRVAPLAHPDQSRQVLLVWPDVVQKAGGS